MKYGLGDVDSMTVRSISPLDGTLIEELNETTPAELKEALGRARSAQQEWYRGTSRQERIDMRELGKNMSGGSGRNGRPDP